MLFHIVERWWDVMKLADSLWKISIMIIVVLLLGACSSTESIQHIEVFMTPTFAERKNDISEVNGYKKVNSITTIEEGKNHLRTDQKQVEDFYDQDGQYLKTEIKHITANNSKVIMTMQTNEEIEQLEEPSTILLQEEFEFDIERRHLKEMELTEEEKERVRSHVLEMMGMF